MSSSENLASKTKMPSFGEHSALLTKDLAESFKSVGSEFGMWDMLVGLIVVAGVWWSISTRSFFQNFWYLVSLVILYVAALKGVIGKISCREPLTKSERARLIRWSSAFIAFFELMHGFGSFKKRNVMAAIIQWTISFLFVFVGIRSSSA